MLFGFRGHISVFAASLDDKKNYTDARTTPKF